ncbi:MAG: polysaccharide biosynthesis protein [Bacilli bacterium]|nr:polysaccharide biosynthesis protein [Bacilli bacterium]
MKKNTFMQGAFVATIGIVITKIIGILYVIPFYAIIGEKGGALYAYAYNIYGLFLGIATVGLPLATSKLVSEYNALGYYYSKERVFKLGKKVITIMAVLIFLLLIILAPYIAYLIIGDIEGGNTIQDTAFVIRTISLSILVVPVLSISRGYLQGHRYITPTSISQVIEQIVRVIVIILGSYLAIKIFDIGVTNAVAIAVLGAFIGSIASYLYLYYKVQRNYQDLNRECEITRAEKNLTDSKIIKQLLTYAAPFIIVGISKNLYNSIDIVTLVRTLVNGLNYKIEVAESVLSVISTWGYKLNMIVVSISTGLIVSLIPNLSSSFITNNITDVRRKVNKALQILLYLTIPMTVGLSFLAKPIWTIFYGSNKWGPIVFSYSIFTALFLALFTTIISMLQSANKYKQVAICLTLGLLTKIILNIPLIYSFNKLGIYAFYGAITATICGYLLASILGLRYLAKDFNISYEDTIHNLFKIVIITILMVIVLSLLKLVIPINASSRLICIAIAVLYSLVGGFVYIFVSSKNKLINDIFGDNIKKMILTKLGIIK